MTQEKKRFREIDALKGVGIAMVLLGHSIIEFPIDLSLIPWCRFLHIFVSSAHMPLFFGVSGYCFGFHGWGEYLSKKARRILVPYLVFSLTGVLAKLLLPSLVNGSVQLSRTAWSVLTGGQHWFLYTLFAIFLFFPLVRSCFESAGRGLGLIAAIGLLQLFAFWPELCNVDNIVKYSFFFALGYYFKCLARRAPARGEKLLRLVKHPLCLLLCLAAWLLLTRLRLRLDVSPVAQQAADAAGKLRLGSDGLSFAGLGEVCCLLARIVRPEGLFSVRALAALAAALAGVPAVMGLTLWFCRLRASRVFEIAGQDSLQLYLFNGYLLTVTRWLVVTKLHIHAPLVVIGANFFVMFFVSLALIELIVKRVKLFRTLTGMV
jgi:fucose 4-O-acetylase-like acetyltransferase